jgi:hypothetical protein
MIESDTIEIIHSVVLSRVVYSDESMTLAQIVYSSVENRVILSIEDPDYRRLYTGFRLLEDEENRYLENDTKRLLE